MPTGAMGKNKLCCATGHTSTAYVAILLYNSSQDVSVMDYSTVSSSQRR